MITAFFILLQMTSFYSVWNLIQWRSHTCGENSKQTNNIGFAVWLLRCRSFTLFYVRYVSLQVEYCTLNIASTFFIMKTPPRDIHIKHIAVLLSRQFMYPHLKLFTVLKLNIVELLKNGIFLCIWIFKYFTIVTEVYIWNSQLNIIRCKLALFKTG